MKAPYKMTIEVDVRPSRRTWARVVALVVFLASLAVLSHFLCGCYDAKDPNLPDCTKNPESCGGYPSSPSFMHKRDGGQ